MFPMFSVTLSSQFALPLGLLLLITITSKSGFSLLTPIFFVPGLTILFPPFFKLLLTSRFLLLICLAMVVLCPLLGSMTCTMSFSFLLPDGEREVLALVLGEVVGGATTEIEVFLSRSVFAVGAVAFTMMGVMVMSSGKEYCSVKVFALSLFPLMG